ncbi:MAG: hypothetical protein JSV09_03255 [Thermoplasmata archaeon]|nr:MAG: hypothetical protein JSV09_03255 [Thermoplasmata archaeon]
MSKIGIGGTIFSIFSGFIFISWGLFFIYWSLTSQNRGSEDELCILVAIPILAFGFILVLGGLRQLKGIRKGKDYEGPSGGIK